MLWPLSLFLPSLRNNIDTKHPIRKALVIQTVGFGDHILSTSLLETLHARFPELVTDVIIKNGNEPFFQGNPLVRNMWVWNKRERKYRDVLRLTRLVRAQQYDLVVNVNRFFNMGLVAVLSGARIKVGYRSNPLSLFFDHTAHYLFSKADGSPMHEIERNHQLIEPLVQGKPERPRLYPSDEDLAAVSKYKQAPYICIAVAGAKLTNSLPLEQWVKFIKVLPEHYTVYLLGGERERPMCAWIKEAAGRDRVEVLASQLSLIESPALMKDAVVNFTCDSSPLHMASAMNAPVVAVFCSTNLYNGFGPLSDQQVVVETLQALDCRPCTTHGRDSCPRGHLACATTITTAQLLEALERIVGS